MIKNNKNSLYVGITENPKRRLNDHNSKKGSKFTKERGNFEIVFLEEYETLYQARRREIQVKKWRRDKKDFLINKYKNNFENT